MTHEHLSPSPSAVLTRSAAATTGRAVVTVVGASVVASALDAAVARLWHAGGASAAFTPLHSSAYIALTVVGVIAGTLGWCVIRARGRDPKRTLRVLVPVVLLLSFVPDLLVGATGKMAGGTWGAVSGLMLMHLLVAAVLLTALRTLLPLPAASSQRL